jgi:hypothetical protein
MALDYKSINERLFQYIKIEIERLCSKYDFDCPEIKLAYDTDPCDFTDYDEIRINLNQDCDTLYHARHVFGHWIADLHGLNDEMADKVADTIVEMVTQERNIIW